MLAHGTFAERLMTLSDEVHKNKISKFEILVKTS